MKDKETYHARRRFWLMYLPAVLAPACGLIGARLAGGPLNGLSLLLAVVAGVGVAGMIRLIDRYDI